VRVVVGYEDISHRFRPTLQRSFDRLLQFSENVIR
jgi:hypothetical protein